MRFSKVFPTFQVHEHDHPGEAKLQKRQMYFLSHGLHNQSCSSNEGRNKSDWRLNIPVPQAIIGTFDGENIPFSADADIFLNFFAAGDVTMGRHETERLAIIIKDRSIHAFDGNQAAIFGLVHDFTSHNLVVEQSLPKMDVLFLGNQAGLMMRGFWPMASSRVKP